MLKMYITQQGASLGPGLRNAAKKAAKTAAKLEGRAGELRVSLLVTDDENIRALNKQYRQLDQPTDVLSFPSDEPRFLGDIAISMPRAAQQAREYNHTEEREVAFLTAHAMLHLFGYDHTDEEQERIMRDKQREIMKQAGFERDEI